MSLPAEQERRRAERREVRLVIEGCPGVRGSVDWATNLSLEGMRLERRLPVWPGTELDLAIHLPGTTDPVRVRAVIVAGHPSGTGVRFVELGAAAQRLISDLLLSG